tara:strand:- start:2089 stop:3756 length:1668 start_codon:yes stop_codon:yes gene_type:complete
MGGIPNINWDGVPGVGRDKNNKKKPPPVAIQQRPGSGGPPRNRDDILASSTKRTSDSISGKTQEQIFQEAELANRPGKSGFGWLGDVVNKAKDFAMHTDDKEAAMQLYLANLRAAGTDPIFGNQGQPDASVLPDQRKGIEADYRTDPIFGYSSPNESQVADEQHRQRMINALANPTKSATDPFDLTQANVAANMTPEDLQYYQGVSDFARSFDGPASSGVTPQQPRQDTGGPQNTGGGGGGGGGTQTTGSTPLQTQRAEAYETLFANKEAFAQDKFDSVTGYLNELQVDANSNYAQQMGDLSVMYDRRRDERNKRFETARNTGADRSSLAMSTLADLGITPDANTFDPITGSTKDMLFSQQQSGADMLNIMSDISNQMLQYANSEAGRNIAAGLQQTEMTLAEEMANIQFARDNFAISDIEAALAQEKATAAANAALANAKAEEESMNAYAIQYGREILGITDPATAIATYHMGGMEGIQDSILNQPIPEIPEQRFDFGLGFDMTIDEGIRAGFFDPPEVQEPQYGGIVETPMGPIRVETPQDYALMREQELFNQ